MKKSFAIAALLVTAIAAPAAADQGFSADMVMRSGPQETRGKMYFSPKKIRFEMDQVAMITRLDRNVTWMVMPGQGMYMEQAVDPKAAVSGAKEVPGELERQPMGVESVNGYQAQKFKVTYTTPEGNSDSIYQWVSNDVPLPVRVAAVDGSWSMDYMNIIAGDQPANLFEPPQGFEKMSMPSMAEMMAAQPPQE